MLEPRATTWFTWSPKEQTGIRTRSPRALQRPLLLRSVQLRLTSRVRPVSPAQLELEPESQRRTSWCRSHGRRRRKLPSEYNQKPSHLERAFDCPMSAHDPLGVIPNFPVIKHLRFYVSAKYSLQMA